MVLLPYNYCTLRNSVNNLWVLEILVISQLSPHYIQPDMATSFKVINTIKCFWAKEKSRVKLQKYGKSQGISQGKKVRTLMKLEFLLKQVHCVSSV